MGRKRKELPKVTMYKGMWEINSSQKPKWWTSIWDIIEINEEILIIETKKIYHYEGNSLSSFCQDEFDYKYVVVCKKGVLTMYLVPMYSSLHRDCREMIRDYFNLNNEFDFKLRKMDLQASNVLKVFICPVIRTTVNYEFPIIKDEDVSEELGVYLTQIGVSLPVVDKLKDFELDRIQPDVGLKGKELILGMLFNAEDFIRKVENCE